MLTADQIITRNSALKSKAQNWRTLWQECADYALPRKGAITTQRVEGQKLTTQIFDTTACGSLGVFAAGLLAHLTPNGEIWARLVSSEREPDEDLARWFDEESAALMEELHSSNFYVALHEAFISLGCFGTAAVLLEEGRRHFDFNFAEVVPGSFAIAEDHEGVVDTVFREWKWTARQAAQQWGEERLGPKLRKILSSENGRDIDREFTFLHAVFPRAVSDRSHYGDALAGASSPNAGEGEEVRSGFVDAKFRRFASVYVSVEDRHIIEEGGYYEMPYAVCRLLTSSGEVYGRGPISEVMPDIKLINLVVRDMLLAIEKALNPPAIVAEDSGVRLDLRPGGVTTWDATNPANKPEFLQMPARIDVSEEWVRQTRERIQRACFVDMFHMLNRPEVANKEKTATEVNAMMQEKMPSFSPIFAQVTKELLSPLLQRAFAMRLRSGRASEPPQSVVEGGSADYKITFAGRIAQEIKATQDQGSMQVINLAGMLAQIDPNVLLVVNWQKRFRSMARNWGLPVEDIRTEEEVAEIMQAQAEAAQEAQEADQMQAHTSAVKNLGPSAQEAATQALLGAA